MPSQLPLNDLRKGYITGAHLRSCGHIGIRSVIDLLHSLRNNIDEQLIVSYYATRFLNKFCFHGV